MSRELSRELCAKLFYDPGMVGNDIDHSRRGGQSMSPADKDRVSHVAHSRKFKNWLDQTQTSSALLILANMKQSNGPLSPLSVLSAELAHKYVDREETVILSFFCGLHADHHTDPPVDAAGMLIGLTCQLLSHNQFGSYCNLGFIDEGLKDGMIIEDMQATCKVFKTLVSQVKKPTKLFIFVDAISKYETPRRLKETRLAIKMLKDLVQGTGEAKGSGVVIKLLVTAPGQSCNVENMFQTDEVFRLEQHIDGARQGVVDLGDL